MKIKFEVDETLQEEEIVIRCKKVTHDHLSLQEMIERKMDTQIQIEFYDRGKEYYFSLTEILFFETSADGVFAHTKERQYQVKYKLYELEEILPRQFLRVAKSMIVNVDEVYAITKSITSSSTLEFYDTAKQAYASRGYYKELKNRLTERRRK